VIELEDGRLVRQGPHDRTEPSEAATSLSPA
jgi:hypothetical protein